VLFVLLALTILAPVGIWMKSRELEATQARLTASVRTAPGALADRSADRRLGVAAGLPAPRAGAPGATVVGSGRALSPLGQRIRDLLRGNDPAVARPGEMVLVFTTPGAYQEFLAAAAGLPVAGRIPELSAVWLVPGPTAADVAVETLARALEPYADEIAELGPNRKMFLAVDSAYEKTPAALTSSSPALLGLPGAAFGNDPAARRGAAWGRDFMIALLDTGVAPGVVGERTVGGRDAALVGTLDAGWGTEPAGLHGSGTAAILSWVAPGARLVGVRVTDDDGVSDLFSVAQGIVSAVNVGANVLAVSPVSPEPAQVLSRAVGLAAARGVAVVASTGGAEATWPATDPRVLAIGSILTRRTDNLDAAVSAPQLTLDQAPLDSAASAAIVAGALADVMSVYPGTQPADAWASLQYMTAEPTAERTILAANFLGSGLQVLNLGWIGMSLGEPAGFRGPGNPANLAFARGGARSGRVGAANPPSRVLVGPQPTARRGGGPASYVRGVDAAGRGVPLTQSDRTVRGNTVPIGDAGRVGQR
jgi:hypothetical protein